ncbi:peptidoglycan DD-metalloendopeptidase family protein [Sphingobium boeckii]|uniref:Murein DD-endopeptidase MepM/ murein hydrolase activator NlpD n=1 Tax=Sphingobium boeckii TaxID=1082345 RepID=A0A7W9AIJ4_9SPHN|nr:murein DD-endopeptidase MepM/ murein hydrolase activator NlpD [Sphingobium boeckii]
MNLNLKGANGLIARVARYFPDREIYVRSGGQMRFLKITSGFQIKLASATALAAVALVIGGALMITLQVKTNQDRIALDAQQEKVTQTASRVQAYRSSVDGMADRIEARQQKMDQMIQHYFGDVQINPQPAAAQAPAATPPADQTQKISSASPAAPLAALEQRQFAFAERLSLAAAVRARQAENAIRRLGLDPRSLIGPARNSGMGGPFIPAKSARDPHLSKLAISLQQLDRMERTLLAMPNSAPAFPLSYTSGFGYRADPFTGAGALHAGMDVGGYNGQPIFAASAGRVTFVGQQNGYGNLVVVDHGHGLETRYGHLSGFNAKVGDVVKRGQQVARMGSTGRSTGTHLHFEVRVQGRAINPRPFLEANEDVLKVQDSVKRRFGQG